MQPGIHFFTTPELIILGMLIAVLLIVWSKK